MSYRKLRIILLFIFISALILPNFSLSEEDLEEKCLALAEKGCQNLAPADCRGALEECEKYYQEKSSQIESDITKTEQEKKTLQNKIYTLKKKIENLSYQIYQSNLIIKDLGIQVEDTKGSIQKTSLKIEDSKEKLSNILRNIYEEDQKPIIEILLSEEEISDFFDNLIALEELNLKSKELLQDIKVLKSNLEQQKQSLDEEKDDLERMVKIQTLQKEESAQTKKDQEYYLKLTEEEYQKQLREKTETQKKATEIRARIFELIGVPEAPTFGEAYEIAKFVSSQTGIRPALLLAVLTQESNIGKNVGQCFLKNPSTGEGVRLLTGKEVTRVMNPSRDVSYFLEITKELGRDPYNTPVSCPMSVGWGGAMGPAQFIPSTWVTYQDKFEAIIGHSPDPWNIKDAFLAAGVYLKDLGVLDNEFWAVMRYFSGYSWSKWEEFYGRSVLAITAQYEQDIKEIE